jgi:hypothetical protein
MIGPKKEKKCTRHFSLHRNRFAKIFEGLLRSIVFQILSQQPALDRVMSLKGLEAYQEHPHFGKSRFWTVRELERALRQILALRVEPLSLILFFDALDEFDGHSNVIGRFLRDMI